MQLEIRLFSTELNILYTVDRRLIPRYCSGNLLSNKALLGIGLMIEDFQIVGITPDSNICEKSTCINLYVFSFFSISLGRLSIPTAFLSLATEIAYTTSSSVMASFFPA